jgi:alpha-D-ribose 1-methylphosphonate 5-triphosphate diphosphatase
MSLDAVFTNARIVMRHDVVEGSVRVKGSSITEVAAGPVRVRGGVDLEGDYLLPGLVEIHTDMLEKHAVPRPKVQWPTLAAVVAHDAQLAAAGITTVLDGLAVGYVVDTLERPRDPRPFAEAIHEAQMHGLLRAEHFFHMRCEISTAHVVDDFDPFVEDPLVRLVSLMDHTPGQRQFIRVDKYREYNQGKYGLSEQELDALIAKRQEDQAAYGERHRAAIVRLCHKHGFPLASHDDATLRHVEEAVQAGVVIAEFPTTVEAAAAARTYGLAVVAGAPNLVLGGSHSGNVSVSDLAAGGLLDILSSDYVPASLLQAAFLLHRQGLPLPAAVATVTATPAERVALADRGEIVAGRRADLLRVRVIGEHPVVRGVWRDGRRIA